MKIVNIHSLEGTREIVERIVLPHDGMVLVGTLISNFLVSPGQTIAFGVSLTDTEDRHSEAGIGLWHRDARRTPACAQIKAHVQVTHDYRWIPSEDPLYEILGRVVQHGIEKPTHGTACVCMDQFSYELRRHISRALPMSDGSETWEEMKEWEKTFDARSRIKHVLRMAQNAL